MAPTTPVDGLPVASPSGDGGHQPSVNIGKSTQSPSPGSSSTQKISTGISSHTMPFSGQTYSGKSSTSELLTTRISSVNVRSTTLKPASASLQSNPPNTPSSSTLGSTTTRRVPIFSVQTPGGNHPNYSTILPPISQGQHGEASSGVDGANTSTIIAGVLVPLIIIGVAVLIIYVWYRRKYPVRMVLGRDFNRFSNPAYSKRASTLTLVRNDEHKEWDTLCRRNPDLNMINEDIPDGIDNQAFDSENEVEKGNDNDIKAGEEIKVPETDGIENKFEEETIQHEGIRRERPKTKKAILVKTSTMEDFENGFELVTESDLGQRTESEVSSGNDSTETHTISLTFSETFDERHKADRRSSDMSEVKDTNVTGTENNDLVDEESSSSKSESDETIGESIVILDENLVAETAVSSQSNESFEVVSNTQNTDTRTVPEEQNDIEGNIGTPKMSKELYSEELTEKFKLEGPDIYGDGNESSIDEAVSLVSLSDEGENMHKNIINPLGKQSDVQINDNVSNFTNQEESRDGGQDNSIQTQGEDKFRNDVSFEKLSCPEEEESINLDQSLYANKIKSNMTEESDRDVFEKEKTEVLEKEKVICGINNVQNNSSVNVDGTPPGGFTDNLGTKDEINKRKLASVQLSNENIVLDSVPQSPTVLVQESFILENESQLPVYLDNTNISPRRGRRAFTLNDITLKQTSEGSITSEFSLPKYNDEISKSSPVISDMKTPHFILKQTDFEFKYQNENQSKEGLVKSSVVPKSDNIETETFKICTDESEERQQERSSCEIPETYEVKDKQENQLASNIFDTSSSLGLECTEAKNGSSVKRDEMFRSFDSMSSEFDQNEFDNFNSTHQNSKDNDLDTLIFLDAADITLATDDHAHDKTRNEINPEIELVEENAFLDSFPQSSTPTTSFVVEGKHNQIEELGRKKLLPQSFDFDNFDDTDSESSSSEESSEIREIMNTETSIRIVGNSPSPGTETKCRTENSKTPEEEMATQQTGEHLTVEDMCSLTRSTDSSTALSWEVLSRENSQDSRSAEQFDLTTENNEVNEPERLGQSVNEEINNESMSSSIKPRTIDFDISGIPEQSSANDTSLGSSQTTDISWEIVHEEGDNSEC